MTEGDIVRAAGILGLEPTAFEARFVVGPPSRRRLRKPRNAQCYFLHGGGCSIHPAKPIQCRTFPFWPELVEDGAEWEATAARCPGIHQGPLIPVEAIGKQADEVRQAFPTQYRQTRPRTRRSS